MWSSNLSLWFWCFCVYGFPAMQAVVLCVISLWIVSYVERRRQTEDFSVLFSTTARGRFLFSAR